MFLVLDQSGTAQNVLSGVKFTFSNKPFQVTDAPGPDGKYTIVLVVSDAAGHDVVDATTVDVKNTGLDTTLQGFKDLGFGLSFLYPFDWTDASTYLRQDGSQELDVSDVNGIQTLATVNYADVTSLADVETKVKAELNAVDGLTMGQSTAITVGNNPATSIAYQYTDTDGTSIVGTAVAVYSADTKQGYLLEIEAPKDQADAAQKIFAEVLKSSTFFAPVQ
jgi:hypothetical protein